MHFWLYQDSCIILDRIMILLLSIFGDEVWFEEIYVDAQVNKGWTLIADYMCQLDEATEYQDI